MSNGNEIFEMVHSQFLLNNGIPEEKKDGTQTTEDVKDANKEKQGFPTQPRPLERPPRATTFKTKKII